MSDIGRLIIIRRLGIPKRPGISPFWFENFTFNDLAALFNNLVNFVPVTGV